MGDIHPLETLLSSCTKYSVFVNCVR